MFIYTSSSPKKTRELGEILGSCVEPGQIILLSGNLGSGKTVFVKGIAEGMGIKDQITSPTYSLINEYTGNPSLFHLDLYRLENSSRLNDIGVLDYLEREGVMVVEWPEILKDIIPDDYLEIIFCRESEKLNTEKRELKFSVCGLMSQKLFEEMLSNVDSGN